MKFNWDDLSDLGRRVADTISEAADTVGKKTGEVVELQKVKNQMYSLLRANDKDFLDMGKMLYEKYQAKEAVDPALSAYCEEIARRAAEIHECEKKIVRLRGNGVCRECQTPLSKGMSYCPTCGAKVETDGDDDIFEDEGVFDQDGIFEEEKAQEETEPEMAEQEAAEEAKAAEAEIIQEAVDAQERAASEAEVPDSEESLAGKVDELEGKEGEV